MRLSPLLTKNHSLSFLSYIDKERKKRKTLRIRPSLPNHYPLLFNQHIDTSHLQSLFWPHLHIFAFRFGILGFVPEDEGLYVS